MQAWLQNRWQALRSAPRGSQLYWAGMACALALGVFLRLNGYLGRTISLWLDEALWAPRFLERPLLELGIRPLGFVWLTRLVVQLGGASEAWFRFLPNLAGLASLALMPFVACRLLAARPLRLLLVLLFAIHPALVDLSNEFKPYSFEVLVHLLPLALFLRFEQTQGTGWLWALLGYLPVSFLLAYNVAFAFPGLLLLCCWRCWRAGRRSLLVATLVCGLLCGATSLGVYKALLSGIAREDRTESYWGKKYDVFYRSSEERSRVDWTVDKYADMAALIGLRRQLWSDYGRLPVRIAQELGSLERWLWIALYGCGVVALWRRRAGELLLLVAPLGVLVLLNALGKWPLGAFRTNLFTAVYLFPVPFMGLQLLSDQSRTLGRALTAMVVVLSVAPGFLFGFDWHGHKRTWTRDHHQREVIERIYELRRQQLAKTPNLPRARLVLDLHTYESHEYYLNVHPEFSAKYRKFFQANFIQDNVGSNTLVSRAKQRLRGSEPVWMVASKTSSSEAIEDLAKSGVEVLARERIADQHLILILDRN
jgi:hypothetical protein